MQVTVEGDMPLIEGKDVTVKCSIKTSSYLEVNTSIDRMKIFCGKTLIHETFPTYEEFTKEKLFKNIFVLFISKKVSISSDSEYTCILTVGDRSAESTFFEREKITNI